MASSRQEHAFGRLVFNDAALIAAAAPLRRGNLVGAGDDETSYRLWI